MRALIIGCGYLGLRVAQQWRQQGVEVWALTRKLERAKEFLQLGLHPIIGDVLDPGSLKQLPEVDVCLTAVGYDRQAGPSKEAVYIRGASNVMAAVDRKTKRLIAISSSSVYGQQDGSWVNETSVTEPTEEGGKICLAAERLALSPSEPAKISSVVLRLSGIYGPGRLIARKEQLMTGQPLSGNPAAWLNLIEVSDAAKAVIALAERPEITGIRLLSDEQPLRREEFYGHFTQLIGAPPPRFEPAGEGGLNKRCDSSRLRAELPLQLNFPNARAGVATSLGLATDRG